MQPALFQLELKCPLPGKKTLSLSPNQSTKGRKRLEKGKKHAHRSIHAVCIKLSTLALSEQLMISQDARLSLFIFGLQSSHSYRNNGNSRAASGFPCKRASYCSSIRSHSCMLVWVQREGGLQGKASTKHRPSIVQSKLTHCK